MKRKKISTQDVAEKVAQSMKKIPMFEGLTLAQLGDVAKQGEMAQFEDGENLLEAGTDSNSILFLFKGEGAVTIPSSDGDGIEVTRLKPPAVLGEQGVLLGEPRTATVRAVGEVMAVEYPRKTFVELMQKYPAFSLSLSQVLARRLRDTSAQIPMQEALEIDPDPEAVAKLPLAFCERKRIVPLKIKGSTLELGVVDDPTPALIENVGRMVPGMDIVPIRIPQAAFDEFTSSRSGLEDWGKKKKKKGKTEKKRTSPKLDAILARMVEEGASDLHLSADHSPRWRVDGDMRRIEDAAELGSDDIYQLLVPIMPERNKEEFDLRNDTDFGYEVEELARFRVNMFRDHHGVGAVFRYIPSNIVTMDQLGLPKAIRNFADIPKGLVLVTGPTGSGKSTTLASLVHHINLTKAMHIITLEDPIEFVHPSKESLVNQREIGTHAESFSSALRAVLREDPDVVLVGELRDPETVQLALETANTGHLVFATLHTSTAVGTIDRVLDFFPADMQEQVRGVLSESLRGVVSQVLLKKRGGGRIAAFEVLVSTPAVNNLIRENKVFMIPNVMTTSKKAGMSTLNEQLHHLVMNRRMVTFEDAREKAIDKHELAVMCGKAPSAEEIAAERKNKKK